MTGARVAVRCGSGALSEVCVMVEVCKRMCDDEDGFGSGVCVFVYVCVKVMMGCVFVDDGGAGSKTLYEALRSSVTVRLVEMLLVLSVGVDVDVKV